MWNDIKREWQIALEEAWTAFCNGSTPIGAAIFDENNQLIIRDRNRANENGTKNRRISHAEANALRNLDTDRGYNLNKLRLYTTMEPCPMCLGTIIMAGVRNVHYAAADAYCGAMHLLDIDSYMMGKNTQCEYVGAELEFFQLTIQSYYELRYIELGSSDKVLKRFETKNPKAIGLARKLFAGKVLDEWSKEKSAAEVFDAIISFWVL